MVIRVSLFWPLKLSQTVTRLCWLAQVSSSLHQTPQQMFLMLVFRLIPLLWIVTLKSQQHSTWECLLVPMSCQESHSITRPTSILSTTQTQLLRYRTILPLSQAPVDFSAHSLVDALTKSSQVVSQVWFRLTIRLIKLLFVEKTACLTILHPHRPKLFASFQDFQQFTQMKILLSPLSPPILTLEDTLEPKSIIRSHLMEIFWCRLQTQVSAPTLTVQLEWPSNQTMLECSLR